MPVPDLFVSSTRRSRSRLRTTLLVAGVVLAVASLVAALLGTVSVIERNRVPVGTTVGDVAVGGKDEEDARAAIAAAAASVIARPIRLIGPGGVARTSGRELGATALVDEALAQAMDAGPLDRLLRHVGIGDGTEIALEYRLGPVRAAQVSNRIDRRFGEPARDAAVVVKERAVEVEPAAPGTEVDRGALRRALRTMPTETGVTLVSSAPVVSTEEATRAAARVEQLLSEPRRVRFRDVTATLWPNRLRTLVGTERTDGELAVRLDPEGLAESLRPRLGRFEQAPRDATFAVGARRARVVPSRPGKALDGERIGRSLVNDPGSAVHLARFTRAEPALTTEAAARLGIEVKIAEFTTYHPCCASRVNNIHRGADIIDGTIVQPGKRFDLNTVMGKRTTERGFLSAPQIFNGRLEDAVGGGVSQIATTMYNAAFFGGMQIVTHQPHEFYISRYPMGREATVSWGGPELIWRNDWPAAVLVKMLYTDTSVTVRLYSSKLGRRVTTESGQPCCYVSPRTITVSNSSLTPGTTSTVQSAGPSGFTISYTRKVFRNGKLKRNERYTWRYRAENAIVEVGPPAKAKPKPKPAPGEDAPATPDAPVEKPSAGTADQ